MSRHAVVEMGIVTNIVEASSEFAAEQGWPEIPDGFGIGDLFDGETFSSPVEPAADLEAHRSSAMRRIVDHINVVTQSALTAYPAAEVESWPIQKVEAETILAAALPTLTMAPFLVGVCQAQFGPADDAARLDQVLEKAGAVKSNADSWAAMAAYVNGLRARTQLAILGAEDVAGIDAALAAGVAEGEAFKEAHGL